MRLSPRQFWLLENRIKQEHTRQELLGGILSSVVANYSMGADPDNPKSPADFMPSIRKADQLTDEQIAARIDATLRAVAVPANTEG